ncbi:E3 SUMO-protein ligase [Nymphaea thermarum]|nr:E3 SUMO-protein ligase [Nymphaea thermarum]
MAGRMQLAVSTLYDDNQSLITDIRKAFSVLKGIAVDLERDKQFDQVKEIEGAALELLAAFNEVSYFSSTIQQIGASYVPPSNNERIFLSCGCRDVEKLTDFGKLIEEGIARFKSQSTSQPQNHPLFRQFKEAIWNVHHAGQPMPGDEQEEIVMTSTQCNLLNTRCPISGKPVDELDNPVRSMDCKHIYEKKAIMHYMKHNKQLKCPAAGCPKILVPNRVVCDPLLLVDIEELRSRSIRASDTNVVEDCTEID